jgi:2-polyprenyl-3-methyl-5-hydroxy-6-metoxy-1,4-benzoquinol methylase
VRPCTEVVNIAGGAVCHARAVSPLPLTGERTLPGIWHENYWFRRHEAAYRWAVRAVDVRGRTVVEAGVGEGYGGQLLARAGARTVLGIDLDEPALRHVRSTYDGVLPVRGNLDRLPVGDGGVDVVVSAQTVEHLWDQRRFVAECARVLRPGGRIVLTTPNRLTFPAGNPFHSRELDARELAGLVAGTVAVDEVSGLHHGPRLVAADSRLGGLVDAQLATAYDRWDGGLRRVVASVTADDFVVGGTDGCLDLLLVGTRG